MKTSGWLWPLSDCLSLEVTTHCNSVCGHCFVRARGMRRADLKTSIVRSILRDGYEAGYRHLHITGGEPLMWKGLFHALDFAFEKGFESAFLNTNGTLLTGLMSRRLAAYHDLDISVSLQGPRPLHERIRGAGSYDRTIKGIACALDTGLAIEIFLTVGRSLIPALPRYADELFRTFPALKQLTLIQLIRVPKDTFDLSGELLSPKDFLRLVRTVSLLNLSGLKTDLLNNPLAAVASKLLRMPWMPTSPPLHRPGNLMIRADLRVTVSHTTTESYGKYAPGDLKRILASRDYSSAVSTDRTECPKCRHFDRCREKGMIRPSEWFRDMFPNEPYCKRVLDKALSSGTLHSSPLPDLKDQGVVQDS